jgi:serine/threonine protein kinase
MTDENEITPFKIGIGTGVVRQWGEELTEILRDPERLLDSAEILKNSRSTKAGVAPWPENPERRPRLFVKRHNIKGPVHAAKYALRPSRAFREFRAAIRVEALKIPTPRPLAALTTKRLIVPGPSYFLCEAVENVVPTLDFLRSALTDETMMAEYISATTTLLAKLHAAGILHGDTKCSNFFVAENGGERDFGVWDLLSCRFRGTQPKKEERYAETKRFADSIAKIAARLSIDLPNAASAATVETAYQLAFPKEVGKGAMNKQ